MTNIPTDLLRTLVSVVDLRSFTKAAQSLGVTQPAVSAQIKRLQFLLGADILDKSAPGVSLTSTGELVVTYARRLLSINDQILHLASPGTSPQTLRIGMPEDFIGPAVAWTLSRFRTAWPHVRFQIRSVGSEALLRLLREGELDLAVAFGGTSTSLDARHSWMEPLTWLRSPSLRIDSLGAIPLISCGDDCVYHRAAMAALNQAGRDSDVVFTGGNLRSVASATAAGLGVTVLSRGRFAAPDVVTADDTPLPKLPDAMCGVYVRTRGSRDAVEQLADAIASALRSTPDAGWMTAPAMTSATGSAA